MNPINLLIVFIDGSKHQVTATAADLIAFESHFNLSISALSKDPRLTYMFFIAWSVENRTKATELTFEEWASTVEIVSEGDDVKK